MDSKFDRRLIAGLLAPHFPDMAKATSGQWHDFLDKVTGLETPPTEPNATAFDRWREKLALIGYPVGISAERAAKAKADAEKLVGSTGKRAADLAALAKEAPNWPVEAVLEARKRP